MSMTWFMVGRPLKAVSSHSVMSRCRAEPPRAIIDSSVFTLAEKEKVKLMSEEQLFFIKNKPAACCGDLGAFVNL